VIHITPHKRAWVTVQLMDFRAGINGLAAACGKRLAADPLSGALFVFGKRPHGNQRPDLRRPGLLVCHLGPACRRRARGTNIQSEGRTAYIQLEHAGTSRA
jgi:hypothetical protein